jgi:phosphate transport system substrate-binding protein
MAALLSVPACADVRLVGSGATFPAPLYKKWVADFQKVASDAKLDYNSVGSGGGIKAITDKTVAFAGSDAPLNKKQLEAMGGEGAVVQVPSCAGAVVPAYNVPGLESTTELKFTGEVLAQIYLGTISMWNDAAIGALNPGVKLPALAITPAYRSDGSGTTFVFTNYLATQSDAFKETIGMGTQVKFPVGQGGKGNEGVSAVVQQTAGAIGYIEANYATANKITFGSVKNLEGEFVKASPESVSLAGAAAAETLKGTVLSANIWNKPGKGVYPISAFTYLIVHRDLNNLKSDAEARMLVRFLRWATSEGQRSAKELDYAPLSAGVQAKVQEALGTITYQGKPVLLK